MYTHWHREFNREPKHSLAGKLHATERHIVHEKENRTSRKKSNAQNTEDKITTLASLVEAGPKVKEVSQILVKALSALPSPGMNTTVDSSSLLDLLTEEEKLKHQL